MAVILPGKVQIIKNVASLAIEYFCILDVHKVVIWVQGENFLIAKLSLLVVLPRQIDISQLKPRLSVLLVQLEIPVQGNYRLIQLSTISVQRDESLD